MTLLFALLHTFCITEVHSNSQTASFDGEEHWTADELAQCEMHGTEYSRERILHPATSWL